MNIFLFKEIFNLFKAKVKFEKIAKQFKFKSEVQVKDFLCFIKLVTRVCTRLTFSVYFARECRMLT